MSKSKKNDNMREDINEHLRAIISEFQSTIESLEAQKVRTYQEFENAAARMKNILNLPSNKYIKWFPYLEETISRVIICNMINDSIIEVLEKYNQKMVDFEISRSVSDKKVQNMDLAIDLFAMKVVKLENKIAVFNKRAWVEEKLLPKEPPKVRGRPIGQTTEASLKDKATKLSHKMDQKYV